MDYRRHRPTPNSETAKSKLASPKGRTLRLLFVIVSSFAYLCFPLGDDALPADTTLHRDYFGMHRFDWRDENGLVDSVNFHLGYGDTIRLLRSSGFEVEDLIEIRPPEEPTKAPVDTPWEWARRWPSVESWKARKRV